MFKRSRKLSDLLRNARQVKYERSQLRPKAEADELASFLHKSRNSMFSGLLALEL